MTNNLDPEGVTRQNVYVRESIFDQAAKHGLWLRLVVDNADSHMDLFEFRGPLSKLTEFLMDVFDLTFDQACDDVQLLD